MAEHMVEPASSGPTGRAQDLAPEAEAPRADQPALDWSVPNGSAGPTGLAGQAARVEALEAELADWQRRAVVWRERALSTQALNDALSENLEDLRAMLQLRTTLEAPAPTASRAPTEQWWNKVFRRETWVSPR